MSYYDDYLQLVKKTPYYAQAACIAQMLASVNVRPERVEDAAARIGTHFCNCDGASVIYAIRAVLDGETLADIPSIAEVLPAPSAIPEPVPQPEPQPEPEPVPVVADHVVEDAATRSLENIDWPQGVTARHVSALHQAGMLTDQDIRVYASQAPLEEIDGIGEKTAEKILSAIGS